jgi:hypothetical protein
MVTILTIYNRGNKKNRYNSSFICYSHDSNVYHWNITVTLVGLSIRRFKDQKGSENVFKEVLPLFFMPFSLVK